LFEANIWAKKISLPQGQSYTEREYYNGPEILPSNKSAVCRIASLVFSSVFISTSSDVWHWHLYIRDPARKNQWVSFISVEWTSAFKGFFLE